MQRNNLYQVWLAICVASVLFGIFDIVHSAETLRCIQLGWVAGISVILWTLAWLILGAGLLFFRGRRPSGNGAPKTTSYHLWTAYFCLSGFVLAMIILYALSLIGEVWDRLNLPEVQSSVLEEVSQQFPSTNRDTFSELQPQCIPKSLTTLDFEGNVLLLPIRSRRTAPEIQFNTWEMECSPYIRITLNDAQPLELKDQIFTVTSLVEWHERKCGYPPSNYAVALDGDNPVAIFVDRRIEYPEFDEFRNAYICQLKPELRNRAYHALNRSEPSRALCSISSQ